MAGKRKEPVPPQFDLDLDVLAPDERTFKFKGQMLRVPGDIAVPTVIEAMKLRGRMENIQEAGEVEQREAIERLYELVMEIVEEANPGVGKLRLSVTQLMYLLGLILSGEQNVELGEAVHAELTGGVTEEEAKQQDDDIPPTGQTEEKAA